MEKLLTLTILLLTTLAMLDVCLCYDEQLTESIREVYSKLVEAEKRGADIREPVLKLNRALQLVREAENNPEKKDILLSEARTLVEEVDRSIPLLLQEGESRMFWKNAMIVSTIFLVAVAAVLTYLFGPKLFWGAWLRLRSKWIIELLGERQGKSGKK